MKKLEFKSKGLARLTPCPHGKGFSEDKAKIGSAFCRSCEHYASGGHGYVMCCAPKGRPAILAGYFEELEEICGQRGYQDDTPGEMPVVICTRRKKKRVNGHPQYFEPCCEEVCPVFNLWKRRTVQ